MVSRGQFSSMDALLGATGLTLVFMLGLTLFSAEYSGAMSFTSAKAMEERSIYAMEELLSPGSPTDWQAIAQPQIDNFGIEEQAGILSLSKVDALNSTMASDFPLVAERIGLSGYNFSVEILGYYNNSQIYYMGWANETSALSLQRVSSMGGAPVLVRMRVS